MRFRLRDTEMPLDPDVERELEAIDAGLAGLRLAPELEDLADLAVAARAERSGPDPEFAARLDEWAAAGFPREGHPARRDAQESGQALGGLWERFRALHPRRLLISTGAAATLVVAVAVGIGVSGQIGGSGGGSGESISALTTPRSSGAGQGSGGAASQQGAPSADQRLSVKPEAGDRVTAGRASGAVFERANPPGGAAAHRKVAENADLVLSAEPQDVRDVADGVVGVVDRYNGFVVSSDVTSGRAPAPVPLEQGDRRSQQGSGTFELRIPAQSLQAALGDLSKLEGAHVASRTEGTVDITKRFNSAKAQVEDLEAQRSSLLKQLGDAVTIPEQGSIKRRLAIVENQLADAKDRLGHVKQRVHLVPVNVEIRGQQGVDTGSGGGWGIGDAFHDAGRVLTVIAGILLISAAVLVPLGLLGTAAWITARAVIRRRREDALE